MVELKDRMFDDYPWSVFKEINGKVIVFWIFPNYLKAKEYMMQLRNEDINTFDNF